MLSKAAFRRRFSYGIPASLPEHPGIGPGMNAPRKGLVLSEAEVDLAVKNALRYFPTKWHLVLAPEFLAELREFGRIYMYRFRPADYDMKAYPLHYYPGRIPQAKAMMHNIMNNLDPDNAQFPNELITYGLGSVFQNWIQYRITMEYLVEMTNDQCLVMSSGHPVGLFPRHNGPFCQIVNGQVIPAAGTQKQHERLAQLGVTMFGQMTAGSWIYIGSQGIVHGTYITLLNAGRKYLGLSADKNLKGKLFVSSGLGGMSGAQGKACKLAGGVALIAEVQQEVAEKRHRLGWVDEIFYDVTQAVIRARDARDAGEAVSIAYSGNVMMLLEELLKQGVVPDLGSDQTSLHMPEDGGYYPVGLTVKQSNELIAGDEAQKMLFKAKVRDSLVTHVNLINNLCDKGMHFWDYGNSFLAEAALAGAQIMKQGGGYLYPSYVQDIMGPLCFDNGFGPFRWVCTSRSDEDLALTDRIACEVLEELLKDAEGIVRQQFIDNIAWIKAAGENNLAVGSRARILYANAEGREKIALAFWQAVKSKQLKGKIIIGRDHHDPSGTDSPRRETADIYDGSNVTADMSVQTFVGNASRGATWVSLHRGGGVGVEHAINGGVCLLVDGKLANRAAIECLFFWDVVSGVTRRAWSGSKNARAQVGREKARVWDFIPTEAYDVSDGVIAAARDAID
jgi:urocanate hydratase